jgi:hypothetical protein
MSNKYKSACGYESECAESNWNHHKKVRRFDEVGVPGDKLVSLPLSHMTGATLERGPNVLNF